MDNKAHLVLGEFDKKCLISYWNLLIADFDVLANLSTFWDIVKIPSETLEGADVRFMGSFSHEKHLKKCIYSYYCVGEIIKNI